MVRKGPVVAWEIVSTALYVHEWAGQVKGCNLTFCMLTSEHPTGRHCWQTLFCTSHRGSLGVSRCDPRSPLWCHKNFWSCVCIIHGKLLCKSLDLKMRAEGKEKTVLGIFVANLVENGQWEEAGVCC